MEVMLVLISIVLAAAVGYLLARNLSIEVPGSDSEEDGMRAGIVPSVPNRGIPLADSLSVELPVPEADDGPSPHDEVDASEMTLVDSTEVDARFKESWLFEVKAEDTTWAIWKYRHRLGRGGWWARTSDPFTLPGAIESIEELREACKNHWGCGRYMTVRQDAEGSAVPSCKAIQLEVEESRGEDTDDGLQLPAIEHGEEVGV